MLQRSIICKVCVHSFLGATVLSGEALKLQLFMLHVARIAEVGASPRLKSYSWPQFVSSSYFSFTKISEREVRIATRNVEKCNY